MGKEGIRIVTQVFSSENVHTEEEAQFLANYYLENYRFIYANPDDDDVSVSFICIYAFSFQPVNRKEFFKALFYHSP
jgi:hypothetical protein